MPAWLIKLAIQLIPPEKAIQIGFAVVLGSLALLLMCFIGPVMVFTHVPLGKTTSEFGYYVTAAQQMEQATGVNVNWQQIMAIDAVVLNQDFSWDNVDRVLGYQKYFIEEDEETIEQTCSETVVSYDAETGESVESEEEYDCSETVTVYRPRPYPDVLKMLVDDEKLPEEKVEDVLRYLEVDVTPLAQSGAVLPDWRPAIHDLAWPIPDVFTITSLFGSRIDPTSLSLSNHGGVDIGAPKGTPVLAAQSGQVLIAGYLGSAGNAVVIQHGGNLKSHYYHLSKIAVRAGDTVTQNQVIGNVGTTGNSTGPHLHFEVRRESTPIDPLSLYREETVLP